MIRTQEEACSKCVKRENGMKTIAEIEKKLEELCEEVRALKIKPPTIFTQNEFVKIPAGMFIMGSPESEKNREIDETQHPVKLSEFWIQTTPVTQRQWGYVFPQYIVEKPNYPKIGVSWHECQDFIRLANELENTNKYRLPTEAEWEYACRAGSTTRFCFGDDVSQLGNYAWSCKNAYDTGNEYIYDVGTKLPNAWGLYDMHGNVWEWCEDWYGEYSPDLAINPIGPFGSSNRVIRGGGWSNYARGCRSAFRYVNAPGNRDYGLGFRLAFSGC